MRYHPVIKFLKKNLKNKIVFNINLNSSSYLPNWRKIDYKKSVSSKRILGGGVLVHQFTNIGEHSLIGGGFRVVQDVPPFIIAANHPLAYKGVNLIGLKRRGFSKEDTSLIKKVYKIFFRSGLNRNDAIKKIELELPKSKVIRSILDFINDSSRGII